MKGRTIKKIGIILAALVILGVAGFFVWKFLPKPSAPQTVPQKTISKTEKELSKKSRHPWPMFHGNYDHTGYAEVKGPEKANLKWKFKLGKMEGNSPNSVAISEDGTIYVAGAGKIFALDKDGKEKWSKNYRGIQGPALSEDGSLYFVSEKSVIALNAKDGSEKWQFKTGGNTIFGPTVGPDGTIYQGSWDGYFYAIKPDGQLKWKYKTAGAVSYPASLDKNGIIYLGGGDAHAGPDSNLYAFSPDGTLKWKYDTKTTRVGSPAIGFDGLIYAPAAPTLFVLDSEGKLKWKKGPEVGWRNIQTAFAAECGPPPLPPCKGPESGQPQKESQSPPSQDKGDIAGIISPALTPDGLVYLGNSQGVISAINPKTQEIKWTYKTGPDPKQPGFYGLPSFPLVDKEGTVYIGSVDGKMYALDKNGKLLWEYQTDGRITEASPALGPDGILYFTSEDGYLYAIEEG